MNIEMIHKKLSMEDLEAFEQSHHIVFPEKYRSFLLKYNGGYPNPSIYKISDDVGESVLNIFYGIGGMYDNLEKKFDIFDEILDVGFIPIADDPSGNQICLGVSEEYHGQIFHWSHDEENDDLENMYFLANDIDEFLNNLYEDSEE
ncbi:SMI1/KNR4 family protein [Lysinibacillus mangiferihumi]|uniref:SMI1/KNR4 family protein n=1 Tax=Lysinibacillus mangiferihumi TaxID=1130819 RepID=A0A4U2YMU8_9BACI|nr:SMI1/KNR4 family protein [Lysinibacillus mangiferihumi]TKI61922.1 SMI1/KNR4 family protein [Lysinibacillus mangiferihumi]